MRLSYDARAVGAFLTVTEQEITQLRIWAGSLAEASRSGDERLAAAGRAIVLLLDELESASVEAERLRRARSRLEVELLEQVSQRAKEFDWDVAGNRLARTAGRPGDPD